MSQAHQVHTIATQCLELTIRPPELPASHCGDEMGQVMPEPIDQATQRLNLLGLWMLVPGENCSRQYVLFVEQNPIRSAMVVIELAFVAKRKFNLYPHREKCRKQGSEDQSLPATVAHPAIG